MKLPTLCKYCSFHLVPVPHKGGTLILQCNRCGAAFKIGIELDSGIWLTPLFNVVQHRYKGYK